jgi:ATP synthase protein I
VLALDLDDARGLAYRFVLLQAVVTLLAAAVSLGVAGKQAAASALLGGGISTAGSLAMALVAFRRTAGANGLLMLAALLVGEATKLFVVVALFVVVLTLMKVAPVPMFSTYVATFLVYWVVFASRRRDASPPSGREMR